MTISNVLAVKFLDVLQHLLLIKKTEEFFLMCIVWAWDGYGHSKNLKQRDSTEKLNTQKHSIIVSRSHQGDIETVAKGAFGDNVEIITAGGAGKHIRSCF